MTNLDVHGENFTPKGIQAVCFNHPDVRLCHGRGASSDGSESRNRFDLENVTF